MEIVWTGLKVIADKCGCSKGTLREWINRDGFPAWKKDGSWRAVVREVEVWFIAERNKGRTA